MSNSKFKYEDDEKYYFVSIYRGGATPAWIRSGFLTKQEVQQWINACAESPDLYTNLQIYPESVLEQKIVCRRYGCETSSLTLREALFGSTYAADNEFYTRIKSGEKHFRWKQGYKEWLQRESTTELSVSS